MKSIRCQIGFHKYVEDTCFEYRGMGINEQMPIWKCKRCGEEKYRWKDYGPSSRS